MSRVTQSRSRNDVRPHRNMLRNLAQREITGKYALLPDAKGVFGPEDWSSKLPCIPLGYSRSRGEVRTCGTCGRQMRKAVVKIQLDVDEHAPFELVMFHEPWCTVCHANP